MRKFYAVFTNPQGLRLTIIFRNENWCGIAAAAEAALAAQPEHAPHGPWTLGTMDVTA